MLMTRGAAPLLRVESIVKRFRQGAATIDALQDASLTVDEGEFVAVMGSSGCGKSTLMHVIAGLTRPDSGRVLIGDQDLFSLSDRRLTKFRHERIGLVFQAFNLIPTLTAEANIALPLLAAGRSNAMEERLNDLIERIGLTSRREHLPDSLSGGEQQRVAIARAIVQDPAIVLADEPTGSLDSNNGQAVCQLLYELSQERRRTIIVVTHEPSVAAWADRVVVMKDGRVQAEFDASTRFEPQELAARYQAALHAPTSLPTPAV
ncbi:ABC transporter ATP-binding protein [Lacipirellula parvula]|uniref:ABC transporter-related protein n=1 Tax=Lacipirellula parvula TaxID=2650471 RepID=A0A5K7X5R5_9BACT|nr:ABC transporter ATP-binding protein [Lacipirellula parvula]BBO32084.1 ABC transporter-related protein [Lacipirellula parvula]